MKPVSIEHRGQAWNGHYETSGRVVSLHSAYGSRDADAGRRKADTVAAEALRQLVDDWCASRQTVSRKRQKRPRPKPGAH